MIKNILFGLLVIVALVGCNNDDDDPPLLFMEKFDMTQWQMVEGDCNPAREQDFQYGITYVRFEKNHPGFMRYVGPDFRVSSCDQVFSGCWAYKETFGSSGGNIQISHHLEDYLLYTRKFNNSQGTYYITVTLIYEDGIMSMKQYNSFMKFTGTNHWVRSEIDIDDYLCD